MQHSHLPLRVLVAAGNPDTSACLADTLTGLGHQVVAVTATGRAALDTSCMLLPDVVLLGMQLGDLAGIEIAEALRSRAPSVAAVLLTGELDVSLGAHEPERSNAMAILAGPPRAGIVESTLRLAVCRLRERSAAEARAADLSRRLEERKLIERAKGILMRRTGSSEAEAYRILQRSSQDRATSMAELARAVIASEGSVRPTAPPVVRV